MTFDLKYLYNEVSCDYVSSSKVRNVKSIVVASYEITVSTEGLSYDLLHTI